MGASEKRSVSLKKTILSFQYKLLGTIYLTSVLLDEKISDENFDFIFRSLSECIEKTTENRAQLVAPLTKCLHSLLPLVVLTEYRCLTMCEILIFLTDRNEADFDPSFPQVLEMALNLLFSQSNLDFSTKPMQFFHLLSIKDRYQI